MGKQFNDLDEAWVCCTIIERENFVHCVPHCVPAQTVFLRTQKHIEDLEIPLVSESTANKFNKKWKQGYLFVL